MGNFPAILEKVSALFSLRLMELSPLSVQTSNKVFIYYLFKNTNMLFEQFFLLEFVVQTPRLYFISICSTGISVVIF